MIAGEGIPVQTIAPKFTGRFNKGVDYVGDLAQFEKEFDEDLSVIAFAIREFALAETLKLSVHSGSDKFSIYSIINRLIKKHHSGLHVKTAGTTWLEEVIGLAESGGEGLALVKEVYSQAHDHFAELAAPYSTVIDIDPASCQTPNLSWAGVPTQYADALRHVESSPHYNPHFRQLLHVGFKVAAGMGKRFTDALEANEEIVGKNVTENLFDRHLRPSLDETTQGKGREGQARAFDCGFCARFGFLRLGFSLPAVRRPHGNRGFLERKNVTRAET